MSPIADLFTLFLAVMIIMIGIVPAAIEINRGFNRVKTVRLLAFFVIFYGSVVVLALALPVIAR